jgi:hypothetical protein
MISSLHNKFVKQPDHQWCTWEKFLAYHVCDRGKHGADGKQSFKGEISQNAAKTE